MLGFKVRKAGIVRGFRPRLYRSRKEMVTCARALVNRSIQVDYGSDLSDSL